MPDDLGNISLSQPRGRRKPRSGHPTLSTLKPSKALSIVVYFDVPSMRAAGSSTEGHHAPIASVRVVGRQNATSIYANEDDGGSAKGLFPKRTHHG